MDKQPKSIRVTDTTHHKAKLLAALLNLTIQEAVDLALTEALKKINAKEGKSK